MKDTFERPRAPYLMNRMAETLGLNIGAEYNARLVSRRQLERAVSRCENCGDTAGCEVWLEDHTGGSREAPGLCPNKALFDHLREGW